MGDISEFLFESARKKLEDAVYRYNPARDKLWLKVFNATHIEKHLFRDQMKIGLGCRLSEIELEALLSQFTFERDGYVDGSAFLLLFKKIQSDFREKDTQTRLANIRKVKEQEIADKLLTENVISENRDKHKVDFDFSKREQKLALSKMTEAAAKYDKNMPGAPSLEGFSGSSLTPSEFKDQLKQCFGIKVTAKELGALMRHFDINDDGFLTCQEFLVKFFRLGFLERTKRLTEDREEKKRFEEMRAKQAREKIEAKEKYNQSKVNYEFSEKDKESALIKLKHAAKMFDRQAPGAPSLSAFDLSEMPAYVFADQLKQTFHMKLSPHEMGGIMQVFDVDGNGLISCQEFTKIFLAMGFAEREADSRAARAKEKKAAEAKKAAAEK